MLSLYFPMISSIQSAIYFDDAISGHLFRVARKVRKLSASNVCVPSTLNNSTIGALADDLPWGIQWDHSLEIELAGKVIELVNCPSASEN